MEVCGFRFGVWGAQEWARALDVQFMAEAIATLDVLDVQSLPDLLSRTQNRATILESCAHGLGPGLTLFKVAGIWH